MNCFKLLTEHTHSKCLVEHHHVAVVSSLIGNKQLTPSAHSSRQVAAAAVLAAASPRPSGSIQEIYNTAQHRISESYQGRQQQRPGQRSMQPQSSLWGYLTGTDADQWTWDDDYNPGARARAAAEAQQLAPTPRQQALAEQESVAAQQRPTVVTRLPEHFNSKVLANGVLLVDKPPRWSSTDIVRQLKQDLKVRKIGVGGPLDAQATGLVIVLLGAATRLTPKLEPLERTYTGVIQLGVTTTTFDSTGQTVQVNPWQHITDSDIHAAAAKFQGEVMQVPCMWSSTKFKNRPLRWYAERGEAVVREPRAVQICTIEVWRGNALRSGSNSGAVNTPGQGSSEVHFRVVSSKGASMRVLADDLGKALGCGAHLASLRREGIGGFSVETAWALDVLLPLAKKYAKGSRTAS